jgi:hypothetical protein
MKALAKEHVVENAVAPFIPPVWMLTQVLPDRGHEVHPALSNEREL